jgi:cyclohexanone monooxygenase
MVHAKKSASSPKNDEDSSEFLDVQVCIVGAGISGICVARGLEVDAPVGGAASYTLLESSADLGGTWSGAAGYPGAACDVPSHLYSFSFALNAGWVRAVLAGSLA